MESEAAKPLTPTSPWMSWAFGAPYLILMWPDAARCGPMRPDSPQRALALPARQFPRWEAVYQQTQRWFAAGGFQAMTHYLRWLEGRAVAPTAVVLNGRTIPSTPKRARAGYDGQKKRTRRKARITRWSLRRQPMLKRIELTSIVTGERS